MALPAMRHTPGSTIVSTLTVRLFTLPACDLRVGTSFSQDFSQNRICSWTNLLILIASGLLAGIASPLHAAIVTTNVYSTYTDNAPFGVNFLGSPVATLSTPDLAGEFGAVSFNGLTYFASDSLAHLSVTDAVPAYTFVLASAQEAYAFIDGTQILRNESFFTGQSQTTLHLSVGLHSVEVQYEIIAPPTEGGLASGHGFEFVFNQSSGSPSIFYADGPTAVPEPSTFVLLGTFGICLVGYRQLRQSRKKNGILTSGQPA